MDLDETRDKLLKATLELISEKGYTGATTREIAARAGVSELTLFRKFGKKELLFEEMLRTYTFLPRMRDLLDEIDGFAVGEGLRTIGVRFLQTLRKRHRLVQILISEMSHYPKKVRTVHSQVIGTVGNMIETYLNTCRTRGDVRSLDMGPVSLAFQRTLFATFLNETVMTGRKMSDNRIKDIVDELVEVFLHGIASENGE